MDKSVFCIQRMGLNYWWEKSVHEQFSSCISFQLYEGNEHVWVCVQRQCKMPFLCLERWHQKMEKNGQWRRHITNYLESKRVESMKIKRALNSESEENLYWLVMPFNHLLFRFVHCANWIVLGFFFCLSIWLWIRKQTNFQWKLTIYYY